MAALWSELEHEAALHNLNTTVYYLRRSLEPKLQRGAHSRYIRREGACCFLADGQGHWLDVDAFESELARARRASDPDQAMTSYRQALDHFRGEFLADLDPDLSFCWMERERLRGMRLKALEEMATLCTRRGRDLEAEDLCLQALAIDPCREGAVLRLMRLALRRGDRVSAVFHYRRLREALWRELEVLPSRELTLLHESAQGGD
jgi:DNA-binding SARP family transcriptional activator